MIGSRVFVPDEGSTLTNWTVYNITAEQGNRDQKAPSLNGNSRSLIDKVNGIESFKGKKTSEILNNRLHKII